METKILDRHPELEIADIACGSGRSWFRRPAISPTGLLRPGCPKTPRMLSVEICICVPSAKSLPDACTAQISTTWLSRCASSMWLVSLDRELVFFVDDKIFPGNPLLGLTSLNQLRKLHIDPSRVPTGDMFEIFDVDTDAIIRKAAELRRDLATEIKELDPARNSAAKQRQLAELHRVTNDLRTIADAVIAAGLALGGKPGRAPDEAYENLRVAVKAAYPETGEPDRKHLDSIIEHGLTPAVPTDYRRWRRCTG